MKNIPIQVFVYHQQLAVVHDQCQIQRPDYTSLKVEVEYCLFLTLTEDLNFQGGNKRHLTDVDNRQS